MESNMDDQHEIMDEETVETVAETEPETIGTTDVKTVKYAVEGQEKPLLKDAKTGKFIKGTGSSGKGGRKKGSRDRVSQAMVDLATDLVANRGAELFAEMADRDPAQALALVAKIVPPEEMRKVFEEEREPDKGSAQQVTINLVSSPSPRLSDNRTSQQIEDRQRGLEAPVERIQRPTEDVVATQDDRDAEVAQERREQSRRYKEGTSPSAGYKRGQRGRDSVYWGDQGDEDRDALRDAYEPKEYL
jgi:hypothetical protein